MCAPASFIVTRRSVWWSRRSDRHEDIIEEHGLSDGQRTTFVRVEITPPGNNWHAPLDQWIFNIDQDQLPEWWDTEDAERRARAKLPEWLAACVHLAGTLDKIDQASCTRYICGGTVERIYGGTVKYIYGGTVERIYGGTVERIYGGTVEYIDGGTVKRIYGGTVEYIDGGTIERIYGGTVKRIDGGTVKRIDGGTVERIDGGTVTTYYSDVKPNLTGPQAVWIDRSGDKPVVTVGN